MKKLTYAEVESILNSHFQVSNLYKILPLVYKDVGIFSNAAFAMPKAKVKVKPKKQKDPPGTFRNADNELVVGDMRRFLEWQKSQKK